MKVCVVGDPDDLTAGYVTWLARRRGVEVLVLAEQELGLGWSFRQAGDPRRGVLEIEGGEVPLAEVSGAFVRLNPRPPVSAELGLSRAEEAIYAVERRHGLHWLLDRAPFPVVNRPRAGRANGSKPWQMRELAQAGLPVPAWLVTNDPKRAAEFVRACPEGAIYKSCSGLRSRVRRAGPELLERLSAGSPPVVLQRYVSGEDARVHVVGRRTFATEIRSAALDYRFDGVPTAYRAVECPEGVSSLCVEQAVANGLLLAGIDFRLDAHGEWWCLEMNPVPTFLPYEAAAEHPIGDRVVDLIAPGATSPFSSSPLRDLFDPAADAADRTA